MRRALYLLGTYGATLPWLLGMLCFRAAYLLAVWSGRLYPGEDGPNCWVYAARRFDHLQRRWREAGSDPRQQPYAVGRTSRHPPSWVWHVLVAAQRDHDTDAMPLESYSPAEPVDLPWWQAWRRLQFRGRVKRGDL